MLWGLEQTDVVKISEEKADFLFGLEVQNGAAYILSQFGISLVFVTCGARGCYYRNVLGGGYIPSLQNLQVVDTTGAGDIFGGSATWKLLQTGKHPRDLDTQELEEITAFACVAAGLSTTRSSGVSSIPIPKDVIAVRKTI